MSVLTVANARKSFGSVVALDGASLELRRGELLVMVTLTAVFLTAACLFARRWKTL